MYNVYVDLAILGFILCALAMTIIVMDRRPKKGATPATRQQIIIHQQVRRIENEQRR